MILKSQRGYVITLGHDRAPIFSDSVCVYLPTYYSWHGDTDVLTSKDTRNCRTAYTPRSSHRLPLETWVTQRMVKGTKKLQVEQGGKTRQIRYLRHSHLFSRLGPKVWKHRSLPLSRYPTLSSFPPGTISDHPPPDTLASARSGTLPLPYRPS